MIKAIAQYLRLKAGEWLINWTDEALEDYVMFHVEQKTLQCLYNPKTKEIRGVVIGWQQATNEVPDWKWQKTDPNGAYWFWHHFAAESPNEAMLVGANYLKQHPKSATMPCIGMRNGIRRDYPNGMLSLYKRSSKKYLSRRTEYGRKH